MAVVINEFEVLPGESMAGERGGDSGSKKSEEKPPTSPREIELMVAQQLERCARVWAH